VRAMGISPDLTGNLPPGTTTRTPTQTMVGNFWGYDGTPYLGTPIRLYNQIIRKVAESRGNTQAENARLFALIHAAMADAGLLCWDVKYMYQFWRPVVGIREAGKNEGPLATSGKLNLSKHADPSWLPLGAPSSNSLNKQFTPPFPSYPSGHATFGAAALHITRLFYGVRPGDRKKDNLADGLSFISDEYNGTTTDHTGTVRPRILRSFPNGLWEMIEENGISRAYLGVHWTFDSFGKNKKNQIDATVPIGGIYLGLMVAENIYKSGMDMYSAVGPRV